MVGCEVKRRDGFDLPPGVLTVDIEEGAEAFAGGLAGSEALLAKAFHALFAEGACLQPV